MIAGSVLKQLANEHVSDTCKMFTITLYGVMPSLQMSHHIVCTGAPGCSKQCNSLRTHALSLVEPCPLGAMQLLLGHKLYLLHVLTSDNTSHRSRTAQGAGALQLLSIAITLARGCAIFQQFSA